jgi:ankyrin repeat protein/Cdc6-like AAA superfamily ATPase
LNDGDLTAFQNDLNKWALSIEKEMQVAEAQESSGFRAMTQSFLKSRSRQQKLDTKNRVLNFCSTYDHEVVWKQTRKAGSTSLYMHFTEYQEWRDEPQPCTLVFTGKLGSGKSVLLANIVDDLSLSTEKQPPLVAYFFCRHDVAESLKARTILGSLARQLLRTVSDLDALLEICGETHTTGDVDKILEMLFKGYFPNKNKTYFIIDGLDECDDEDIAVLVQAIQKIQERLNILVCASFRVGTNKVLQSITNHFLATRIVLLPENNPDIEAFIETDLERCLSQELLTIGDATLIFEIQDALLAGSQGMFLWAALQIKSLCSMKTDHAIREALADLPKDLSQTFARILEKSGSSDRKLQAKTLQVVLAANRPLTAEELREALSVVPGDANWDPSKMLNDVDSALACCGCLLTVDEEESTVRVVHHSFKQYILHGLDDGTPIYFSIDDAQRTLADIVVTYLGYGVFETQLSKTSTRPIMAQSAPSRILQSTLGTSSTTRHLAMRLLASRKQPTFDLSKTLAEVCGSSNSPPEEAFKFYGYAKTHVQKHIWYVSGQQSGIFALTAKAIQNRADFADEAILSATQSRWAAEHGNWKVIELLFRAVGTPPLIWTIDHGYKDTVEILLNAGADVNEKDRGGYTPLMRAGAKDDKAIVELLLSTDKVDVNAQQSREYTALMIASRNGHKDIVKLLLDNVETDRNGKTSMGYTALIWAAFEGDADVVEVLVNAKDVDLNVKGSDGRTALMIAVLSGRTDVVKLLANASNIDLTAKDKKGRTALTLAKSMGHKDMVILLRSLVEDSD